MSKALLISAIVPVYQGREHLARSLPPLVRMLERGELHELIVVDDGSTDGSGELAAGLGARVLRTPRARSGPGAARNQAAHEATGDVLWFVDADVVAHDDVVPRIRAALVDPQVTAIFGSYDDTPPAPGFASGYMNLRHHFVHHRDAGEASTFWAGCGAVRREAFLAVDGYDAERYAQPSIEDIELGYRLLARGGRIRLDPALQGTHLKRWTLWGVVRTDVVCRALPWARLLHARDDLPRTLNIAWQEQARAGLAVALLFSLPAAALALVPAWLPVALFALALWANRAMLGCFWRARGPWFAVAAVAFHQLHYAYSAAVYVFCWAEHLLGPPSPPPLGTDA